LDELKLINNFFGSFYLIPGVPYNQSRSGEEIRETLEPSTSRKLRNSSLAGSQGTPNC